MLHKLPRKIILWQLFVTTALAVALLFLVSADFAKAAVAGGLIAAFLTLFVGMRAFATPRGSSAHVMHNALLRAQILKFFIAVVLFGLAALFFAKQFAAVIVAYLAATMVYLVALRWPS